MNHEFFGNYLLIRSRTLIPLILWLGFLQLTLTVHRAHSPIHDHPSPTLRDTRCRSALRYCVKVPNHMPIKRCWPVDEPVDLLQVGVPGEPAQNPLTSRLDLVIVDLLIVRVSCWPLGQFSWPIPKEQKCKMQNHTRPLLQLYRYDDMIIYQGNNFSNTIQKSHSPLPCDPRCESKLGWIGAFFRPTAQRLILCCRVIQQYDTHLGFGANSGSISGPPDSRSNYQTGLPVSLVPIVPITIPPQKIKQTTPRRHQWC